jgi:hypothetical protein
MPFRPGATTSLAATSASGSVTLPLAQGPGLTQIRVWNSGGSTVFVRFGSSAATVTAVTTDMPIPAGAVEVFTIGCNDGYTCVAAGITAAGTATLYFTVGQGV